MPLAGRPLRFYVGTTWEILADRAPRNNIISYGDLLEELIGERQPHPDQILRPILDFLAGYCIGTGAPPLTVLVVNGTTRQPGPGFVELLPDLEAVIRDVQEYPWRDHPQPPDTYADG